MGEVALQRALSQPSLKAYFRLILKERGQNLHLTQRKDGGLTTQATAEIQQRNRDSKQEGKITLNSLLTQLKKDPNKSY